MASKSYVGVAALTMARTASGGYVQIYADDPVPVGIDPDDLRRLVDEGFLAEVGEAEDSSEKKKSVDEVLAEVGDDKDKAAAALEAEKAGKNRSTLVTKLQAIVDAS